MNWEKDLRFYSEMFVFRQKGDYEDFVYLFQRGI